MLQQERDFQVKSLPGQAAIMKAKAISDKAATGGKADLKAASGLLRSRRG